MPPRMRATRDRDVTELVISAISVLYTISAISVYYLLNILFKTDHFEMLNSSLFKLFPMVAALYNHLGELS